MFTSLIIQLMFKVMVSKKCFKIVTVLPIIILNPSQYGFSHILYPVLGLHLYFRRLSTCYIS